MTNLWHEYGDASASAIKSSFADHALLESLKQRLVQVLVSGHKIVFAGNGGSAGDSQHLAAEFVGRFKLERPALPAVSLTSDSAILTAVGNDYGFDRVFARQVEALCNAGDALVVLTTSGRSPNILEALKVAKKYGLTTVALCGETTEHLDAHSDFVVAVPSSTTSHIQEAHLAVGHALCLGIEAGLKF